MTEPTFVTKADELVYPLTVLPPSELPGGGIHRAILAVTTEIPPVDRNGELELGGRKIPFTKVDEIRDAMNPILTKWGVVSYPSVTYVTHELQVAQEPMTMAQVYDAPIEGTEKTRKVIDPSGREIRDGKIPSTRSWAEVGVSIRYVFVGDNSEVTADAVGLAYDTNSDKAVSKAITQAVKRILTETFKITDRKEIDGDSENHEGDNRAATTDRRSPEGHDRGGQAIANAHGQAATGSTRRSGPRSQPAAAPVADEPSQPSEAAVAAADPGTGEVPDEAPVAAPEESRLDKAKARVRAAVTALGYDPAKVNAIATEVTGKTERSQWIALPTAVEKLATRLEKNLAERNV